MKLSKDNKIWSDIIKGNIDHKFDNYVIQIKVHQLQKKFNSKFISLDRAIDDLYSLYNKYSKMFEKDIEGLIKKEIKRKTYTFDEVVELIKQNHILSLAADEKVLDKLPQGNWIAGTIPYFMDVDGGKLDKNRIFVDDLTDFVQDFKITKYDKSNVKNIGNEGFENGFTVAVIPSDSQTLSEFAPNSLDYENIYKNPIVGFIAGIDMNELKTATAKTFFGKEPLKSEELCVAIHVKIPDNKVAASEIVNLNTIDPDSPKIEFPETSFTQSECFINGKKENIADFLTRENYKLPLIADYQGALINRDIKIVDNENKKVHFFSPLFKGEKYRLAKPIDNYLQKFDDLLKNINKDELAYAVICVSYLNLGNLEGKTIPVTGPFTFGEISYQLLNQTVVYLKIMDK